jgi:hypothetical protein
VREEKRLLEAIILPRLGKLALAAITRPDIEALRREFAATPVQANRVLSLLHTLVELAKEWNDVDTGFSNPAVIRLSTSAARFVILSSKRCFTRGAALLSTRRTGAASTFTRRSGAFMTWSKGNSNIFCRPRLG